MSSNIEPTNLTMQEHDLLLQTIESYFNHLLTIESISAEEELMIANQTKDLFTIRAIPVTILNEFINQSKYHIINYELIRNIANYDDTLKKQLFFKLFDYKNLVIMNKHIIMDFIQMIKTSKLSVNEAIQILKLLHKHQERQLRISLHGHGRVQEGLSERRSGSPPFPVHELQGDDEGIEPEGIHPKPIERASSSYRDNIQPHQELNHSVAERLEIVGYLIEFYSLQIYELNNYIAYFFMHLTTDYFPDLDNNQFFYVIKQFIMNYRNIICEMNDDDNSIKHKIFDYVYMYKNDDNNLFGHFNEAIQFYMKISQEELNAYYALKELKKQ